MFDIHAYVKFVELHEYEVSFSIKKPYTRSSEIVKASSSSAARNIIEAQYGKEKITILSVRQVKWFSSEQSGVTEILFWANIKVCYSSLYF